MMEFLYTSSYTTQLQPPDFSLPTHIKVFALASQLRIPGLQILACDNFTNILSGPVTELDVYFSAVKEVYANTHYTSPMLRRVVAAVAVSEMKSMLGINAVKVRFLQITSEVLEFQVHFNFLSPETIRFS
jgi:hypothetical protein